MAHLTHSLTLTWIWQSEDWGSEHSSGLLGKFLRRDSALQDRKKKILLQRSKPVGIDGKEETSSDVHSKKPLIAKLKAGANKLHVGCSENDGKLTLN